jgi:NADPH2:quinone reductase
MQENQQAPEQGPIVVTGASGGVGSIAVSMLSRLGYRVIAVTSRSTFKEYLVELGASEALSLEELNLGDGLLEKARFAGVIDNLGGLCLKSLLPHVKPWGNVACIGMTDGSAINTSVFPFILRGVSLLGISSTNCPMPLRRKIWQKIGQMLNSKTLEKLVMDEVLLENVSPVFNELLDRKRYGRTLVNCYAQS